ncbi:MAG TPA: Fic family protein [Ilumatobacteraceae bacterium]|nr:Fic family protein [Ilumatobacteraceae bacterium]
MPIEWEGRQASAFVPTLLASRNLQLDERTVAAAARARDAVEQAGEAMAAGVAGLASMLLRAESLSSSAIAGVTTNPLDLAVAEMDPLHPPSAASKWVAANVAVMADAVGVGQAGPLTTATLRRWHRTLMAASPTPVRGVGKLRTQQGWIGGTSPLDADLVPPPPDMVPALLDDLIAYVNRDDLDPVAQAANAHAQFAIIHPFADGNGRIGRALVAWMLTRNLALVAPPPVSMRLVPRVHSYHSGFVLFRIGDHTAWVNRFIRAVASAARTQESMAASVASLNERWRKQLFALRPADERPIRRDAAAWRALELLPVHLVLTGQRIHDEVGVSMRSSHLALHELLSAKVVVERVTAPGGRSGGPPRLYTNTDLLDLVTPPRH